MMKIITYNVNGLRQRISQFSSLQKLLDSFDADIICFQETKLRRQELSSDLVIADGYESFFSCTRTNEKGRTGYSGVATFCRVKSAFASNEASLPVSAEEGFTGLVGGSRNGKDKMHQLPSGLEDFNEDELLKVDNEGRCIITDHGHFVLFNLYGPRADSDDTERTQFKLLFYKILQKRWESLLRQGRKVFVVGDLNIAPAAMDRCDAGPDFEKNEFRRWFRSMLVQSGGSFFDVFRSKHPDRRDVYTCWPSSTGAEQFNYGSRIDHILFAGSCLHQGHDARDHDFVTCHVKECDVLIEYKRWKPDNAPRWNGGWGVKLEGSDHAPVFVSLVEIPDVSQHDTPFTSSRYLPIIHGFQQTLGSLLMKRSYNDSRTSNQSISDSSSFCEDFDCVMLRTEGCSKDVADETRLNTKIISPKRNSNSMLIEETKKKSRKSQWSQLSLKTFFQKSSNPSNGGENTFEDISPSQDDIQNSINYPSESVSQEEQICNPSYNLPSSSIVTLDQAKANDGSSEEKNNAALLEWQRIQLLMQNSIPRCKGHKEPCVSRVVKKPGPTFGLRFYVCARAEGPSSNPDANCGYFKWASSKSQPK